MEPLTRIQFRRVLLKADQFVPGKNKVRSADIETLIAAISDEEAREHAEIEWQDATSFKRTHPLVLTLAAALGFTPEDVDTLWEEALKL